MESLAREADRLTSPRLRALGSPLLGVDQGEQPETSDVAVGDVRRVGPLDGLQRDPPRLVELAGEEQRLRQAREDADAQDVRARASGRDRATSVLDGRAHVAALDHRRTGDLHDRLDVRRPQLRPLPPRTLRHRKQPLNLDLRGARAAPRLPPRLPAATGARAAARREASAPSQETARSARPRRTRGRARRAARPPSRRPQRRRRTRSRPRRARAHGTKPPRGAAAQPRPRARARAAGARRTDGDSGTTRSRASRATRNMFERASSASTAAESSRPRTASHSSGVNRPSTEVRTRKSLVSGASAVRTSSVR